MASSTVPQCSWLAPQNSVLVCSQWYLAGQKYPSPFFTDIPIVVLFFNVSWKNQPHIGLLGALKRAFLPLNPICIRASSAPTAEPALQALLAFRLFCFVNWSCCAPQASLELAILPPLPFQFWDYKSVPHSTWLRKGPFNWLFFL